MRELVKLRLLDVREASFAAAVAHFASARYFRVIHARYFPDLPFAAMIARAVRELPPAARRRS